MKDAKRYLIHDYMGVDFEEVWRIIERDLPDLKSKIDSILKEWGK